MVSAVMKRTGRKQAFSAAKVRRSVERAAREAKLSRAEAARLVREVADNLVRRLRSVRRQVTTTEIRRAILGRLDRRARSVASAWRRYDRRRKR